MWAYNIATLLDPTHRDEWSEMWTPKSTGMILKSMRTDFKFVCYPIHYAFYGNNNYLQPLQFPDRVTVLHKLRDKPLPSMDHFILDVLILSELHQRPAARSVEDIVVYDYKKAARTPLKPFMVETLARIWDEQEEAKRTNNRH